TRWHVVVDRAGNLPIERGVDRGLYDVGGVHRASPPGSLAQRIPDRALEPLAEDAALGLGRREQVRLRRRAAPLDLPRNRVGDRPRLPAVLNAELSPDPTLQRLGIWPRAGRQSELDCG